MSADDAPSGPVFVVGALGSGTTLVRLLLDAHPNIGIPAETGFMRAYNAHRFIPFKSSGRAWARRLGYTHQEFDAELAAFYERLFSRYAERNGKRRWGDETPLHTFHVDDMANLFEDARFVGVVRHPAAQVVSVARRFNHPTDRAARHWRHYTTEVVRQTVRRRQRFRLVRYEDLVLDPDRSMRDLLAWLGEPWAEEVPARFAAWSGRRGPGDATEWKRSLSAAELRRIGATVSPLAEYLGYDVEASTRPEQLRPDGSPLIRHRDLIARAERVPGHDPRTRVEVPLAARFYDPRQVALRALPSADAPTLAARLPPGVRRRLRRVAARAGIR